MTQEASVPYDTGWSLSSAMYDPKIRGIFFQIVTVVVIAVLTIWVTHNTAANLARSNTASGFAFLRGRAGFEIGQSLIGYSSDSTYGRALLVGILNTLVAAAVTLVLASAIGLVVGIAMTSANWLVRNLARLELKEHSELRAEEKKDQGVDDKNHEIPYGTRLKA